MQVVAEGSGRWLVTIVIVLEHALLLVALLLWFGIPSEPEEVQVAIARRKFLDGEESEKAKHEARLRSVRSAKR